MPGEKRRVLAVDNAIMLARCSDEHFVAGYEPLTALIQETNGLKATAFNLKLNPNVFVSHESPFRRSGAGQRYARHTCYRQDRASIDTSVGWRNKSPKCSAGCPDGADQ